MPGGLTPRAGVTPRRVILHVGLMKSGTTYLQGRLNANRDALAAEGIHFPGPSWARHARAVSDLIGGKGGKAGAWASLRDEINAHEGTSIVSMEYLGPIGEPLITKAVASFPDREVHAVFTVRDLGRSVPAMWQETIKNRKAWDWDDFLGQVRDGGDAGRRFWRQQDAGRAVTRWARVLGPEHVTVITVPPPGSPRTELWDRFSSVCGIQGTEWVEAPRSNESLGAASTLMLRRLNLATTDLPLKDYKLRVKALAKHVLSTRRDAEEPIGFTVPRWLAKQSTRIQRQIRSSGVRVVGDLAELAPLDSPGADPSQVTLASQLDASVAALAEVLRQVDRVR